MSKVQKIVLPIKASQGIILIITQDPQMVEVFGIERYVLDMSNWNTIAVKCSDLHQILCNNNQTGLLVLPVATNTLVSEIESIRDSITPATVAQEVYGYDSRTGDLFLLKSREPLARYSYSRPIARFAVN